MADARGSTGWGWILAGGICSLVFGIGVFLQPALGAVFLAIILAIALGVLGFVAIAMASETKTRAGGVVMGLFGIAGIALAIYAVLHPRAALGAVALLWGLSLLVRGIVHSTAALVERPAFWGAYLVFGLIALGLGVLFLVNRDLAETLIVIIIGIEAILMGIFEIFTAMGIRSGKIVVESDGV